MQVAVLAVGKLKNEHLEALCAEYVRRANVTIPIEVIEVRNLVDLRRLAARDSTPWVVLDPRGEMPTSHEFADWLATWRGAGTKHVRFAIAGAEGFTADDRSRATRVLSLSSLTLPHRLARLVLLEQLYRASTILAGHPYHRD